MSDGYLVLCTVPDEEVAERLAKGLVGARLAACVNVVPAIRSFYRWEGEVRDDAELLLVIKTHPDRYAALEAWLLDAHPYDVPEVIALPIEQGWARYLGWITAETRPLE